jgi:hypothetical protein
MVQSVVADAPTLNDLPCLSTPLLEELDTRQSWLHTPRRRRVAAWRLLPLFQFPRLIRLRRFVCALRLATHSAGGHISVLLSKKQWTVELGKGVQRLPSGCGKRLSGITDSSICTSTIYAMRPSADSSKPDSLTRKSPPSAPQVDADAQTLHSSAGRGFG